jgi:hypothetical protein
MPSVTVIEMFEYVPARADVGVPDKRPFAALKVAQAGLLVMRNVSAWSSGSDAVGWNV